MNDLNFLPIAAATLAQFVVGAIWYMPIFGKLWGKIHCFDTLSAKEQKALQAGMMPYLLVQLFFTTVTSVILAKLMVLNPSHSAYELAFLAWLGFIVPTQVSAVTFGNTEPKWMATKTAIMAGGSLACLMVAATIFSLWR